MNDDKQPRQRELPHACESCQLSEDGFRVRNVTTRPDGRRLCAECANGHAAYAGKRTCDGLIVTRPDGSPLPLRLDLRNHSPTGFENGYGGSGPAQLALALLADVMGDDLAQEHYQAFKWQVVAQLPRGRSWTLSVVSIVGFCEGLDTCQRYRAALARHYGQACADASVVRPNGQGRYLISVAAPRDDRFETIGFPQSHTQEQMERMITVLSGRKKEVNGGGYL